MCSYLFEEAKEVNHLLALVVAPLVIGKHFCLYFLFQLLYPLGLSAWFFRMVHLMELVSHKLFIYSTDIY